MKHRLSILAILLMAMAFPQSLKAQTVVDICDGGTLTAQTGTITDGSGDGDYSDNMDCQILIQPEGAAYVMLSFSEFNTEECCDHVEVYDGDNTGATLLGSFSGSDMPATIYSTGGSMLLRFVTDGGVTYGGWTATYTMNSYQVSIYSNDDNMGTVTGGGVFSYDTTVYITATPNYGYDFIRWSDGNTDNPRTLVITQDTTLTAEFDYTQYNVIAPSGQSLSYIIVDTHAELIRPRRYGLVDRYVSGNLVLPDTVNHNDTIYPVTVIRNHTFWGCHDITSVVLPNGLKEIGEFAFSYNGFTEIVFPETVTSIGNFSFGNHNPLSMIRILAKTPPSTGSSYVFSGSPANVPIFVPCESLLLYQQSPYWGARYTNIIGEGNCGTVVAESVDATMGTVSGSGIYSYGDTATLTATPNCIVYRFVRWSDGDSNANRHVIISQDTVFTALFEEVSSVFALESPSGQILRYSINCATHTATLVGHDGDCIGHVDIPSSIIIDSNSYTVTTIGDGAFSHCSEITSVTIPNTVTSLGYMSFYGNGQLSSITIPDAVESIGNCAFIWCGSLRTVIIGDGVSSIGEQTFEGCGSIETLVIGKSCTYIGHSAFWESKNFLSVTCKAETPPVLDSWTFGYQRNPNCTLYVPCGSGESYQGWLNNIQNIQEIGCHANIAATPADSLYGRVYGGGEYQTGDTALLVAIPSANYNFISWSDGTEDNPYHLHVISDTSLTAIFSLQDTTYIHDTTYVDMPVHDTTYIDVYVHDTTTVTDTVTLTEYVPVHDTTYVDVPYAVHDTIYINVPYAVHDTTYINVPYPVHDTTYIDVPYAVHDTTYINVPYPVHDTTYIDVPYTVHDTTTIHDTMIAYLVHISDTALVTRYVYDSAVVTNTYFDTFYVFTHAVDTLHILDTMIINRYHFDTTIVNYYQYDTTLVNIYDTVINNVYQYDTTIINNSQYNFDTSIYNQFRFDTTLVFDTMIVNVYTYDTSVYNNYQFDTVILNTYQFDTTLVSIYDTTIYNTYQYDTTLVNVYDTVIYNVYQYDTTIINNSQYAFDTSIYNHFRYDTTLVFDTMIVNVYTYDTSIYNNYRYDTVILNYYQYDTTLVNVYDTVINNHYQYDTTIVNVYDTTIVNVDVVVNTYQYDTVLVNYYVYDTVLVNHYTHDTVSIYYHDTVNNYFYDTVIITHMYHDTVIVNNYIYDTIYLYRYIFDTVYIHDTVYVTTQEGIGDVETMNARIFQRDGQIVVESGDGLSDLPEVVIYDAVGRRIVSSGRQGAGEPPASPSGSLTFPVPASGVYLVKIGDYPARKVVVIK